MGRSDDLPLLPLGRGAERMRGDEGFSSTPSASRNPSSGLRPPSPHGEKRAQAALAATYLPRECAPFLDFVHTLRRHGFAVSPDQTEAFLAAITLLGPGSMEHIRQAAVATLAPPIDRIGAFDTLFRAIFYGETSPAALSRTGEEETVVNDRGGSEQQGETPLEQEQGGAKASAIERLSTRDVDQSDMGLSTFRRALAVTLPRRHSFRQLRVHSNGAIDLRRSLRDITRAEGDLAAPRLRRRQEVVRRPLIFIDISGSMSGHTDELLALAHATIQAVPRTEIFTIGTRLSRITTALRTQDRTIALARAAAAVDDWNGGTRIGPALKAFLAIPRFAAMARGALVVIASDGLERGGHAEFESAMRRLSQLSHRLSLATPLAGDTRFRPETAALAAVLPWLDDMVDGSSAHTIARFMLTLDRPAPRASVVWKEKAHALSD